MFEFLKLSLCDSSTAVGEQETARSHQRDPSESECCVSWLGYSPELQWLWRKQECILNSAMCVSRISAPCCTAQAVLPSVCCSAPRSDEEAVNEHTLLLQLHESEALSGGTSLRTAGGRDTGIEPLAQPGLSVLSEVWWHSLQSGMPWLLGNRI